MSQLFTPDFKCLIGERRRSYEMYVFLRLVINIDDNNALLQEIFFTYQQELNILLKYVIDVPIKNWFKCFLKLNYKRENS